MQSAAYEADVDRGAGAAEPLLVTMEEMQRLLGCGKTTAFAIIKAGEIEAVQLGRRRMPVLESVRAYVKRLRERPSEMKAA